MSLPCVVLILVLTDAGFVYPSWDTTIANLSVNISGGLPPIPQQNTTIYNSTLPNGNKNPDGTYNHGPIPIYWNNIFLVTWYNSPQNESQYMRSLMSVSKDGINWSKPIIAFTNFTYYGQENENWFMSPKTNNLYTGCSLYKHNNIVTPIMRQVKVSNNEIELGNIFWLSASMPPNSTDVTKYVNKTYMDMSNETISDIQMYIDSLLDDSIPNFSDERSMYLVPNTTHYNSGNKTYSQQVMLLLRKGGGNHNLWASTAINSFTDSLLIPNDKLFTCRPGTDLVRINMVNVLNGIAANISNNGQTYKWSTPVITNILDEPARTCVAALPDGRIYYLGNPLIGSRNVLVLGLSKDGLRFTTAYAVRYNPPPRKYAGYAKNIGFQYPSAMWIGEYFYVTYSVNKEDIQISKIKIDDIKS